MNGGVPGPVERWFPVASIALLWLAAAFFKNKANRNRSEDPRTAEACDGIAYALTIWAPVAFLPLAVGAILGQATVLDAFQPRASPWGFASMAGTLVVYARLTLWLYWQQGGEFLEEHSSLFMHGKGFSSARWARIGVTLMMLGGITAMVKSWLDNS